MRTHARINAQLTQTHNPRSPLTHLNGSEGVGSRAYSSGLGSGRILIGGHSSVFVSMQIKTGAAKGTFAFAFVEILARHLGQPSFVIWWRRREERREKDPI